MTARQRHVGGCPQTGRCRCPWRVRYRIGAEQPSRTFDTKADADRFLAEIKTAASRGDGFDPRGGDVLLADWIEVWVQSRPGLKLRTQETDAGRIRNHILPQLGSIRLRDVTPLVVGRWVADLERIRAAKTVRNCHGLLHSVLAGAVDEGLLRKNPCTGTQLPTPQPREMLFLTHQQFAQLHAASPERYRPLLTLLVGTGLRWGEAAGLKAGRVDLLAAVLDVRESLQESSAGALSYTSPKSKRPRRVSLPPAVVDALIPVVSMRGRDEPVFTAPDGGLLRAGNFRRDAWLPTLKRADLEVRPRVHDLRHTHAAWLISAGVPLLAVSRRLGHASYTVTANVYGHILPDVDDGVIAALGGALDDLRWAQDGHTVLGTRGH